MGRSLGRRRPVLDEAALLEFLAERGYKEVHATTIWSHVIRNNYDVQLQDIPGLSRQLAADLPLHFDVLTSIVATQQTSADGTTTKLLVTLQDGMQVEAVIMRYDPSAGKYAGGQRGGGPRATLCVSSQIGCKMACTFCATGTMGLKGNLLAGEILEQLVHARRLAPIRNICFMGMGEPFNNYASVTAAIRAMTDPRRFGLSPAHITVSTVGVAPRMRQLTLDAPGVRLAVSLHAPSQPLRQQLVPTATAYPLTQIMQAMDDYTSASGHGVFVEYVMLNGVNDSAAHAHELGALLSTRNVVVNLIPYNPTTVDSVYQASSSDAVLEFQSIVRGTYSIHTTVRQEMGRDIAGACGQLVVGDKQSSEQSMDIEELGRTHRTAVCC
eukprot:jgi/Chlat1/202/Chrsp1S03119